MWSDAVDSLKTFGNYIFFSAIIMVILGIGGTAAVRFLSWKSFTLKIYGAFVGIKQTKLIALSLILARMLFFWSAVIFRTGLELSHVFYILLLTVVIHILLADLEVFFFDLLFTVLTTGELYSLKLLAAYLATVQSKGWYIAMAVVCSIFIASSALYCSLICIRSTVKRDKKEKLRFRPVILVQRTVLLLTAAFIAFIPYHYVKKVDNLVIHQDLYQYTSTGRTPYYGESKITKSGLGCVIENQDQVLELKATPLYYVNENKILLPSVVSIVQARASLTNRIANMSLLYEENNKFYVKNEKDTVQVSDFFLYDGKDTYTFFEPVTIVWENNSLDMTPFSYITVKYNQSIEAFNRETEDFTSVKTDMCDVTTTLKCGKTINLSSDIISQENGQEQMLFLQPNLLEDLK